MTSGPDDLAHAASDLPGSELTEGNRVTLYRTGRPALADMLEAIAASSDHVNLETYILRKDEVGRRFANTLSRLARAGLTVNLIHDEWGCRDTPDSFFDRLRDAGVNILGFRPVAPWRAQRRWSFSKRDHRKILVVDGRVGFTGGLNIGDDYDSDGADPGRWRDTHVRVEGPAAASLNRLFLDQWREEAGSAPPPAEYLPEIEPAGETTVRVFGTGPRPGRRFARRVFLRAIRAAQESLLMTHGYFMPDWRILRAIRRAARRGIDVGIVLPRTTDVPMVRLAGHSTFTRLMKSGVHIHERLGQLLHAKTAVVDGVWSIIGSANMDVRSFRLNFEVGVEILSGEIGREMRDLFREDVEKSEEVVLARWRRRPFLTKALEKLCRMFRPLL